MYFRLNPEIIFVTGKKGSVLCDTFNNKIYHLNQVETDYLSRAENNMEINENSNILLELERECLGTFYMEIPYIHKVRKGSFSQTENIQFNFKRFFLEISNICNHFCNYCGGNYANKRSLGCLGCNLVDEEGDYLNIYNFYDIIDTISKLGCEDLYLTGGDITLNLDFTKRIIEHCKGKFRRIFLVISYKHNIDSLLNLIDENIFLLIQIDLFNLKKYCFIYKNVIYLVVIPEGHDEEYFFLMNELNIRGIPDFLTNKNNTNSNLDKNFEFNLDLFYHNLEFHPCLGKTLFVSSKGNVYPCPLFRTKKWGHIDGNFLDFLYQNKERIYNFWTKNLDHIEGCKECEFRYLCSDCRVIEEIFFNEYDKKFFCSYSKLYDKY